MSNSENVLFEKLSQLGYPNISKFSPSSFDWLFDIEEALPFLTWFCQTVQPANLLTRTEIARYEKLKKDGVTILEGKRLSEALVNQPNSDITAEELEDEIQELKALKQQLLIKKQGFNKKLNNLNTKQKLVTCHLAQYKDLKTTAEADEEKAVDELKFMNTVLNDTTKLLQKTSEDIVKSLNQPKLLCQTSFEQFLSAEEEYTSQLTKFANAQFDENMGTMAQNSGFEMCAFLKICDPNLGELLGLDEKTRLAQNWELNNLQKRLPCVEEDRIANEIEVASLSAAIDASRQNLSNITNGKFPSSLNNLRLALEDLERMNNTYLKECLSKKNEVMNCILRGTEMRCSSVIVGDCSLKLLRQEYFIAKQKEFLKFVAQQWAREQMVLLSIRLEGRQLESLLTTLNSIMHQIQEGNQFLDARLGAFKTIIDSEKTLRERNTIPSSDAVARSLLSLLGSENENKSLIRNYEELPLSVSSLFKEAKATEASYNQCNKQQKAMEKNLEKIAESMEDLIFGGPLTSVSQNLSRSVQLEKEILKLDSSRETVQNNLKPLYRDFKAKQLGIKSDHLTLLERRLWTLFYNDPSSMQRKTEALEAKANVL